MPHDFSAERPYYTFDSYIKRAFGRKLYRLALSAGTTCPNRDGTAGAGGCIFCAGGAGAFAQSPQLPVAEQIERAKARVSAKLRRAADGPSYIAYFQSYTGTYAPLPRLRALFTEAVMHPDIAALSVATRPDCLDEQRVSLLESLSRIRPVWVELGLQSANDGTARLCNRAYPTELFTAAAARLRRRRPCHPGPARRNACRHARDSRLPEPPARGRREVPFAARAPGRTACPHAVYGADDGRVYRASDRLPPAPFAAHCRTPDYGRRAEIRPARAPVERGQETGPERHPPKAARRGRVPGHGLYAGITGGRPATVPDKNT